MRKKIITMVLAACLIMTGILSDGMWCGGQRGLVAKAATAYDNAEAAKAAYYDYLWKNKASLDKEAKKRGKQYKARFTVMDMNKDKVPELKIQFGTYDAIYTYTGGKVKMLKKSGVTGNIGYCKPKNMIAVRNLGAANSMTEDFYQLKDGKLTKKHTVYISWRSMTYRVDGKNVSRSGYRRFADTYNKRDFGTLHEISKNNLKNVIYAGYEKASYTLEKGMASSIKIHTVEKSVSYSSSKKSIVKVNSKGVVTAVKAGTATVTAKAGTKKTGYKKYTCKVKVVNLPKSSEKKWKAGKNYSYDLDGDGKKESVQFLIIKDAQTNDEMLSIRINEKEVYRKVQPNAHLSLVDIDSKDAFQEIRITELTDSACVQSDIYYRYQEGSLVEYARMPENPDFIRYSLKGAAGNGKLVYEIDTPAGFYSQLGNYYALSVMIPENGVLTETEPGVYTSTVKWANQYYTATKTLKVMSKRGGSKEAFRILKLGRFHVTAVIKEKDKVYLKVKNMAGSSGYLKLPDSTFMKEKDTYLWG